MEHLKIIAVISVATLALVTADPCGDNGFIQFNKKHVVGGTKYPEVATVEECTSMCLGQPSCEAVDWNFDNPPFDGTRCWMHYVKNGQLHNNQRVHHHQKCQDRMGECSIMYDHHADTSVTNATPYNRAANAQECKDTCTDDLNCRGYDVTTSGQFQCWLRTWKKENIEARKHVDHHVRTPCANVGCVPSFRQLVDQRVRYGTGYIEITDLDACKNACRNEPNCISLDFVTDDTPFEDTYCWLHFDEYVLQPRNDVDHYQKAGFACPLNVL